MKLTHDEEEFEYNEEVSARVGVGDNSGGSLPVVQEVVHRGQEETQVGHLQEEWLEAHIAWWKSSKYSRLLENAQQINDIVKKKKKLFLQENIIDI